MLAGHLATVLAHQLQRAAELHQRDIASGAGFVELPDAMSRKYPNAAREWPWQWVFPATRTYLHRPRLNGVDITSTRPSCSALSLRRLA